MAIVTISRGSYSQGKEVAEKAAVQLGYACISRKELVEASSNSFHVPEFKLHQAVHDAPSFWERLGHSQQTYLAYLQTTLAQMVQRDNVVYHGLAGHLLLKGIPHVLKVRIVVDFETRVACEMKREKINEHQARTAILRDDEARRKWTLALYGVDPWDSLLYDLVIRIGTYTLENVVDIIVRSANLEQFKATKESQQKMDDFALACQVKSRLIDEFPDVKVVCEYGNAVVHVKSLGRTAERLEKKIKSLESAIPKLYHIEVHAAAHPPESAV